MFDTNIALWHPIAALSDLPLRHVFHAQLLGRELAVWKADDGFLNVWENKCLHRGVRLSIGINDGRELKCQYHGWRYANRTAGCTYIPAHPADAPARTITNRTYPAVLRYGLIWTAEAPEGGVPEIDGFDELRILGLRAVPINAPADRIVTRLALEGGGLLGDGDSSDAAKVELRGSFTVIIRDATSEIDAAFFVQPVDSNRSVIRGVMHPAPRDFDQARLLRQQNHRLLTIRDELEAAAAACETPSPLNAPDGNSPSLTGSVGLHGHKEISVVVARKWHAAEGIAGFELTPLEGLLPNYQPGAHIDVHIPNGLVRQYSLLNGPGETDHFCIGVKREIGSRGGSTFMHDTLQLGDALIISEPRNNFPLRRDAVRTLFFAGGIGVTPLLSMAQALHHHGLAFDFHYFVQSEQNIGFRDRLSLFDESVSIHSGLSPHETRAAVLRALEDMPGGTHLYVCGPGAFIQTIRTEAKASGVPEEAVHFEYFKNDKVIDDSSTFQVDLARSGFSVGVEAGQSILTALRDAGVEIASSCETGACGTCIASVLDGIPDHQDVYLNDTERRSGTLILTCVSRAKSARLLLDL